MPITVTCPSCGWKKSFADDKEGKKTTCPECDEPITIRAKRHVDEDGDGYEVVDDEKPKKRRRSEDDDDSERPQARRRRDEDDDEDEERPRRKKKRRSEEEDEGGQKDPTVKVVSGIATVVLIIGIIILRLWLRGRL
jgi:hypothetical protein